jgi:hypothetical protein
VREWPVRSLHGGTGFSAPAAFFVLRAHATQNTNSQIGLGADLSRSAKRSKNVPYWKLHKRSFLKQQFETEL